jgi:peptidoglycan/LPS O-acetylase OafA/YrhL
MSPGSRRELTLTLRKPFFSLLPAIRGLAALLVVLRHTTEIFAPIQFGMSYMAVDLFFLLSGLVVAASYEQRLLAGFGLAQFAVRRAVRIYPLYLLATSLAFTVWLTAPEHHVLMGVAPWNLLHPLRFLALACLMLPIIAGPPGPEFPYDHPAWSLFFELVVNLVYGCIARFLSNLRLLALICLCMIGLFGVLIHMRHSGTIELGFTRTTFAAGFLRAAAMFFLGAAIFRLHSRFEMTFLTRHSLPLGMLILAAIVILLVISPPYRLIYYSTCIAIVFPALLYAALHVRSHRITEATYQKLGDISYPLYALHVPLYMVLCSLVVPHLRFNLFALAPYSGLVFLLLAASMAYAIDKIFDQPVRRVLLRMRETGTAP